MKYKGKHITAEAYSSAVSQTIGILYETNTAKQWGIQLHLWHYTLEIWKSFP